MAKLAAREINLYEILLTVYMLAMHGFHIVLQHQETYRTTYARYVIIYEKLLFNSLVWSLLMLIPIIITVFHLHA